MNARSQMWDRVYSVCKDTYEADIDGFGDSDSRMTADIAADNWYTSGFFGGSPRRKRYTGLARMPDPGDVVPIGTFLQAEWVLPDGTFHGWSNADADPGVPLWWSDKLQACFVLPGAKLGPCAMPPRRRGAQIIETWTQGRRTGGCSGNFSSVRPAMPVVCPGVQVSYHSDKFGPAKPYIHHFDSRGVLCRFSSQPFNASRAPAATMIHGGKLRLTTHGLAG